MNPRSPGLRAVSAIVVVSAAVAALALSGIAPAGAQEAYPNRPVHVLLGFPPGGGADVLGRHMIARLQAISGKTFVLENKPGAGSNVASTLASRARPDGYTLLMGTSSSLVGSRFFFKDNTFDPLKSFEPLGGLLVGTFMLVTGPNAPASDVAGLTQWLKARPNSRFAHSNQLGLLAGHYIKTRLGIAAEAVSYRSAPEAFPDLASGMIEYMVADGTSAVKPIQDGRIRGIATTTLERHPALPDLRTLREQGLDDADFSTWWAMLAPAGTDPQIVATLSRWTKAIFDTDETRTFLVNSGNAPLMEDGPTLRARITREIARWEPLVKAAGIVPQ